MTKTKYEELGIDPSKASVREIFKVVIDNEYPGAFVNIITDPYDDSRALVKHLDGDGSKMVQRCLHYRETKDETIFRGAVDDALAMNTGDVAASGFVFGPWLLADVLNVSLEPEMKDLVMRSIAIRLQELKELYARHGFTKVKFLGGETADLPDQVSSAVFDVAITAWADKKDLVTGNVRPGDKIYGLASDGRAAWESDYNSGIMSNGLTLARSCLMREDYNYKYPKLKRDNWFYEGRFFVNDTPEILQGQSVGAALLSPTRQWPLFIRKFLGYLKQMNLQSLLHGMSLNTGGGATKIKHVGQGGIIYHKKMPTPAPFFQLIQQESQEDWFGMYKTFNCGVGLDVIGADDSRLMEILKFAASECQIKLYELGQCYESAQPGNQVILDTEYGTFEY